MSSELILVGSQSARARREVAPARQAREALAGLAEPPATWKRWTMIGAIVALLAAASCRTSLARDTRDEEEDREAHPRMVWRGFNLSDLVAADPSLKQSIRKMVVRCVASDSWSDEGGPGEIEYDERKNQLRVLNTVQTLGQISAVLAGLRRPQRLPPPASNARQSIESRLDQRIDLDLNHATLTEVAEEITRRTKLAVTISTDLLETSGGFRSVVSISAHHRPLRSLLRYLLRQFDGTFVTTRSGLSWLEENEVQSLLEPRVYDVSDLSRGSRGGVKYLLQLIQEIVSDDPGWADEGGAGNLAACEDLGCLVISTTAQVHREIGAILSQLRAVRSMPTGSLGTRMPTNDWERFETALRAPATFDFQDAPLGLVARWIEEQYPIEVEFDLEELSDAGTLDVDTLRITASATERPLGEVLNELVSESSGTWVVDEDCGVLLLTDESSADSMLTTRVYAVGDLVEDQADLNSAYETLTVGIMNAMIRDPGWAEDGGAGSMKSYPPCRCLVIATTLRVHREIENLLAQIRRVRGMAFGVVAAQPPTAIRARIETALGSPTKFDFKRVAFAEVLRRISERYKIPIQIDEQAFSDSVSSLNAATPITLAVDAVPLYEALRRMLESWQAGVVVQRVHGSEVLLVTTGDTLETMEVRLYAVGNLLRPRGENRGDSLHPRHHALLVDLIELAVSGVPGWADDGGSGTIGELAPWKSLCICTTLDQHLRIERLLRGLRPAR